MSRIHPSHGDGVPGSACRTPVAYTVWKRSSMGFLGTDGFSVYDAGGGLAFCVDNYSRRPKAFAGELLLMDGRGTPLLALRPQILSLHDRWNCYRAAEEGMDKTKRSQQQLFTMRKSRALQCSDEAEVYYTPAMAAAASGSGCQREPSPSPSFRVEGCFSRRSCKIRGGDGEEAAQISRKTNAGTAGPVSLGGDVFSLIVRPGVDAATVMAIVVVMDRICRRPYTSLPCSSQ